MRIEWYEIIKALLNTPCESSLWENACKCDAIIVLFSEISTYVIDLF